MCDSALCKTLTVHAEPVMVLREMATDAVKSPLLQGDARTETEAALRSLVRTMALQVQRLG